MKVAAALCYVFLIYYFAAPALAGTSGTITGVVIDEGTLTPLKDALVTASSTSQSASTHTDSLGRFTFASLAPDRYRLTVEKPEYELQAHPDARVFADQTVSLELRMRLHLSEIAHVTAKGGSELVRSGTTNDVYSIDAALGEKEQALGGGGELNSAYAAIGSVPGVFVPQGQQGWAQFTYIRGGDSDQIGYEYDGVPLNRAFDNLPAGTLSSLGQQEVQVYTGGGPPSASATGISGFINQVIRTGTYPARQHLGGGIGAPAYYHQLQFEASGASPNRRFAYYAGFSGYNQDYRFIDQFNGGGVVFPYYATPIQAPFNGGAAPMCVNGSPPPTIPPGVAIPGCYTFAPGNIGAVGSISDREGVINLHFTFPHRTGVTDDLQFLFSASALNASVYDSENDIGRDTLMQAYGTLFQWPDGVVFPGGTQFGQKVASIPLTGNDPRCPAPSLCTTYFFPSSPRSRSVLGPLPPDIRGLQENDAAVFKAQFQRNFGSAAYARVFGYSFYSAFLENDPNSIPFLTPDYELDTHTRGVELQLANQLGNHFVKVTANYTTATTTRFNNTTMDTGARRGVTNLIDSAGNCYDTNGNIAACNARPNEGSVVNPSPYAAAGNALANAAAWVVTGAHAISENGSYNTVRPEFTSMSLSDQFRPDSKLFVDAGARYERFRYNLADTQTDAYNFWFRAAQREYCYDPSTLEPDLSGFQTALVTTPASPCPINAVTGVPEVHPDGRDGHLLLSNTYPDSVISSVLSPRIGLTYTQNPDTVWRASFGVYAEPANSAHVQFVVKQPNLPAYIFPPLWQYGYTTPRHAVQPEIANTYDLSYERRFKHFDTTVKITPFLRDTRQQRQILVLNNTVAPFATALNVGHQRSEGVEFALSSGDFSQDGFAAWIAYTYTIARIRYDNYPGTNHNSIDIVNDQIRQFNRFTATGGGFPCYRAATNGPGAGETAAQCVADAGAIENPYYHMGQQPLLDPSSWYVPFDILPTYFGIGADSFYSPNVLTAVFQYQKHALSVTPSVQLNGGAYYGVPLEVLGIDPSSCFQNSASARIAAPNPHQADYTSCLNRIPVPNPESGSGFDGYGEWQNPAHLSVNLQLAYNVRPNIRATLILSNLYNRCFGGSSAPWTQAVPPASHGLCAYGGVGVAPYVSNMYNGFGPNDAAANGAPLNPFIAHSYQGVSFAQPFQAFFEVQVTM